MARRIIKASVQFISLCPRGANRCPVMYKEDGQGHKLIDIDTLVKATPGFDEQGELLAVVYPANLVDAQGDYADEAVVKQMLYDAAKRGEEIDIRHDGKPVGNDRAFVAERFIVQKGDPRFADFKTYEGKPVDVTGSWATVLKIEDPKLREAYRKGEWNGVSMGGTYAVEKSDDDNSLIRKFINALTGSSKPAPEIDMDAKEMKTLLAENNASLAKALTDTLVEAGVVLKPTKKGDDTGAGDKPKAPVFKGDPMNKADVAKHQKALKAWKATEGVDWSDPDAVEAYMKSLGKDESDDEGDDEEDDELEDDEDGADDGDEDDAEKDDDGESDDEDDDEDLKVRKSDSKATRALKKRMLADRLALRKAQRRSNQGGGSQTREVKKGEVVGSITGLSMTKEERLALDTGNAMGNYINSRRNIAG